MTIGEAIKHSEDVAERYEKMEDSHDEKLKEECLQCAADHQQLAEWLTELLQRREWCAQYEVEQILNLEQCDMLSREYEILNERYKEAVRLLKAAVEDFESIGEVNAAPTPMLHPKYGEYLKAIDVHTRRWRYADEAKKILGEDGEQNDD